LETLSWVFAFEEEEKCEGVAGEEPEAGVLFRVI